MASPYADKVLADGAVAYWRLDEASGNALSQVGNFPGTVTGGVTRGQPGALSDGNTAMQFDGSSGYIDAGNIAAFNFGAGSFTIEAWIKISLGARYHVVVSKGGAEPGWRGFVTGDNVLGLAWGTDAQFYPLSSTVLTLNVWQHVIWGYNATTAAVFYAVDGVHQAITATNHPATNAANVRIGTHMAGGYLFAGAIDEVAIYPTALTPQQIAAHYALRTATAMPAWHDIRYRYCRFVRAPGWRRSA